jgi:hypothetical protein
MFRFAAYLTDTTICYIKTKSCEAINFIKRRSQHRTPPSSQRELIKGKRSSRLLHGCSLSAHKGINRTQNLHAPGSIIQAAVACLILPSAECSFAACTTLLLLCFLGHMYFILFPERIKMLSICIKSIFRVYQMPLACV